MKPEDSGGGRNDHILHFPQPFGFEAGRDYDFLRRGAFRTSWYSFFRRFGEIILALSEKLVLGFEISGSENIDIFDSRGAVVVCNHVSVMDCTFLEFAFPYKRTYFTTLESNFRIPVARHLIRWLGGMPIPVKTSGLAAFSRAAGKALDDGCCVIYYPESVLYPYYNGIRDFRPGAFRLACRAGVPVIPVVVTFRPGRGLYALKRRPCVSMKVLPPIEPECADGDAGRLSEACRSAMEKAVSEINAANGVPDDPEIFLGGKSAERRA